MDGGSGPSLPRWWKKAALSLGTAAVVVVAVQRVRRKQNIDATTTERGGVVVIVAAGDAEANAAAKATYGASATFVTPRDLTQAPSNCSSVVIMCSDVSKVGLRVDMALLQHCLEKVAPGATVTAHLGGLSAADTSGLETTSLFAGGVDGKVEQASLGGSFTVAFSCKKPSWATGAAAAIPGAARINEDELLGEVPAPVGKGKSDCSSQPKACANCSCGRKELEDKHGADEAKKRLEQGKERSSCNSCYLGDAFRCDGCPYRGLPAFKPGTKVELVDSDTAGTGQLGINVEAEQEATKAESGGKLLITA